MNKKKVGIIAVVCIAAIGIGFYINKSKKEEARNKVKEDYNLSEEEMNKLTDEEVDKLTNNKTKVESKEVKKPTKDSTEVDKIAGFNYEDQKKVGELKLPYSIEKTDLVIENIGQYTGQFIEDGSDKPVANVLSLLVKNNSNKVVQYGEINIKVNGNKNAVFKVTNLPPKTSTLVMESTGKIEFNKDDKYKYVDSIQAKLDNMSLMKDKVQITKQEDGVIGIKNVSGKDLGTVYVYYKYFQEGGAYLGGITYRVKFENVKAGASVEEKTSHFSKNSSEILMVDAF
ncbi:hypothetical protein SAMN02745147_2121 [Intestinibacter bartlettii DSM 16795]|uniref:hypothetical protein n=1 Tax=Intestinibacter bartlettii TaxID=261299 RepID=UPI00016311B1|nr:hypothetical protein [Intestinibacter bartlettii]EDQ95631.1 hypothetical protein CLOBAR_02336 [Intestinibacter bartlettii DSM 16795]UWO80589.1 hypothetical protein NQ514_11775 [Intestinibacter bartlettii]SKA58681.1 hypothetical protein SAMN02745147_2121 [Intestinibacter bartlettii DSM 16795]